MKLFTTMWIRSTWKFQEIGRLHFNMWNGQWRKNLSWKKGGEYYVVSPWKLTWDDEKSDCIKRYRVDKMKNLSVLDQKHIGKKHFVILIWRFCKADFWYVWRKRREGHYAMWKWTGRGYYWLVRERRNNGTKRDRLFPSFDYGINRPAILGVGNRSRGKVKIVSPESVKEEYQKYLSEILEGYRKRYS